MPRTFRDMNDIVEAEKRALGQEVATVNGRGITRKEITAAFNLVAPRDNWKRPIDATIEADLITIDVVREAVVFFTGSVAKVECVQPAALRVEGPSKYRVTAAGYYATCGA